MSVKDLVDFWSKSFTSNRQGHWIHPIDEPILTAWIAKGRRTASLDDIANRSGRLHLGLRPVPYVGNLQSADIIIAMINPTATPKDYSDARDPAFRKLLQDNINQKVPNCFALDQNSPATAWCQYYRSIFNRFVREYSLSNDKPQEIIWKCLMERIAIMELIPYYSQRANLLIDEDMHNRLPSAIAAKKALRELASNPADDNLIIFRWPNGAQRWDVPNWTISETRNGLPPRWTISKTRNGLSRGTIKTVRDFINHKPSRACIV